MKKTTKILAMILALAMALSLCACTSGSNPSSDDDDDDDRIAKPTAPAASAENESEEETEPAEETLPDVPSAEDQAVLDAYCENLYNFCFASDPVEQDGYYQQLKALDLTVIDKWRNTEFEPVEYRYHKINWDYEAVFSAITVVENVMLNQKTAYTDFIGNVTEDNVVPSWRYNAEGLICEATNGMWAFEIFPDNPSNLTGTREYTKNDAGQITQIRYGSYYGTATFTTEYLVELVYDDMGNKIKEVVTDKYGESYDILYSYDEENRLIRIDSNDNHPVTYEYAYTSDGKLAEFKKSSTFGYLYVSTMVFSYDESGNLVSGVLTEETWKYSLFSSDPELDRTREDQYTFTCDEEGRIAQIDIVRGDEYYGSGWYEGEVSEKAAYALTTITINYGDFYVFESDALFTIG